MSLGSPLLSQDKDIETEEVGVVLLAHPTTTENNKIYILGGPLSFCLYTRERS